MDDSAPMIVPLIPHIMLARTENEHSLLTIVVTIKHVMVAIVVFSGHIIPQLVSIWYSTERHMLATGPQVNVIMFERTSERWM